MCHAHLGQWGEVEGCVGRLKALYTENRPSFAGLPSELLYGHAGFLYALLFVAAFVPSAVEEALVDEVGGAWHCFAGHMTVATIVRCHIIFLKATISLRVW